MKNIRRKAFDIKTLRLSPEEGFVLSRLDAPLSAKELVALTGIEESRVVEIVETLATQGVVDLDREGASPPSLPPLEMRTRIARGQELRGWPTRHGKG
jgi:hypothetical protein